MSLGEVYSGGIRKFVGTMRPEEPQNEIIATNSIETTIDNAMQQATSELKATLLNSFQQLSAGIYNYFIIY